METATNADERRTASALALRSGEAAVGTFVGLGSVPATEICARAGFEWLLVDLEHGAGSEADLNAQAHTAARFGALSIVRVPTPDRIHCSRALDLGADGIMAPRLDTPEDVTDFLSHLRYPPQGDRGVATYHSAAGYGLVKDYFENLPRPLAFVQIESDEALQNVDSIATIDGVDVLFVGPRDLSSSLGAAPSLDDPVFAAACSRVVKAAAENGIAAGILAGTAAAVEGFVDLGFTAIAVGSDSSLMANAAVHAVTTAQGLLDS
ncbi:HpcH/HpaI aldolase family protein [Brevibacterium sp. FME17]|uniref:HpcH/HpaI aldolase family protein n=1 Tax=Brevibacterium sp. FME17 TaxID=2742606 RepID=UPI0018661FC0|nr:aldolase/citrate lyase family protein [Brevibacterium sp. FME17]